MPDATLVNVLKFVSVRPSVLYDLSKPDALLIADGRLWYPPPSVADRDPVLDLQAAARSNAAQFVVQRIQTALPLCQNSKDVHDYSNSIAEEVKSAFGTHEKPGMDYLHRIPEVIRRHTAAGSFEQKRLVDELEATLGTVFAGGMTLGEYVHVDADNASHFCIALSSMFDHLYSLYVAKRLYPINLEFVLDAIRGLNVVYSMAKRPAPARADSPFTDCASALLHREPETSPTAIGQERLRELMEAVVTVHPIFAYLIAYYRPFNILRPVGIGDLMVVKQWLCRYEAGEIAHVENVLQGESKQRVHRSLNRTEQFTMTSEDATEETNKDLETADRYEMSKEVEATVQEDLSAELSGTVSGSYGVTQFSVSAGVAYSQSSTEASRSTSNFAKDVISKAASRIERTVKSERRLSVLAETEETNTHEIANAQGTGHVVGIYRWLDKHYKAQVFNYGKRLMFEVLVPEPAAYLRYAAQMNKMDESAPVAPIKPAKPIIDISTMSQAIVDGFATTYVLRDLEPEPAELIRPNGTIQQSGLGTTAVHQMTIVVPEGYEAVGAAVKAAGTNYTGNQAQNVLTLLVASAMEKLWDTAPQVASKDITLTFNPVQTQVAVSAVSVNVFSYSINVVLTCRRTVARHHEWRIKSYNRINNAYEDQLAKYEAAHSLYLRQLDSHNARKSLEIRGLNPKTNEEIIRIELKKHAITMIAREFDTDVADDTVFDAMVESGKSRPGIDIEEAGREAPLVQFLEQAFEWSQLTYLLYPYFWGKSSGWLEAQKAYAETDPLYGRFLQAGYVRILIPVKPPYEGAVLHFLYTREPWSGGPTPGIDDPLYVSIHDEIRSRQDDLQGARPSGDSWPVVLPTSLVYLQESGHLPKFSC